MAAGWVKNEVTALKRRCGMLIQQANGQLAPPGTDFTGAVFFCGATSPKFALATGTMTNQRRPLAMADFNFTADNTTETFTKVAHGLETGDGPARVFNTGGGLPTGLLAATDYWIIKTGADTFKLATSLANAYAGTNLLITTDGTGTQTLDLTGVGTERGMWGHFEYEAGLPELNHDAPESIVIVDGIVGGLDFTRMNGGGAYTSVQMQAAAATAFDQIGEGSHTYGDLIRGTAREILSKFSKVGNDYVTRDLADTKDSHSGTVTPAGRIAAAIIDLTP